MLSATATSSGGISASKTRGSLRIGLLSQWYEPEPVTIPAVLARELARRGHEVRVLTGFPNFPTGRLYDGYRMRLRTTGLVSAIPVRRVALIPNHGRSALGRVLNYASFAASATMFGVRWLDRMDAVWVYNSPPTVGLPTWFIKARHRPRVVMHVMDIWPESLAASGFGGKVLRSHVMRKALDLWLGGTYETADEIACTTRGQVALLASRGIPPSKLSYVPIWADEAIFRPVPPDQGLISRLGLQGKVVLLYAGALGEPQGLGTLIDACTRLQDEPRFHCVIAGSGVSERRLRSLADSRDLKNVTFLGRWPITDMGRLMSIGNVHLVSLRRDPLADLAMPSKLPATLASGKPVIVAASGDAATVVTQAQAGWACPPGDVDALECAIRAAVGGGTPVLEALGRNGRAAYESEFSVSVAVDRLERLLRGSAGDSHAA